MPFFKHQGLPLFLHWVDFRTIHTSFGLEPAKRGGIRKRRLMGRVADVIVWHTYKRGGIFLHPCSYVHVIRPRDRGV